VVTRKLASIQRVLAIDPIPGADAIERVRINGWQCVAKKGIHAVGNQVCYVEVDSVPPDNALFNWLWNKDPANPVPRPASYRVRTMRLRGCLSQGILLPLSELPLGVCEGVYEDGQDVTGLLGITKYDPPAPEGMGSFSGPFPGDIPKTDEMRAQSYPAVLDELRGHR
jgi:RNA ligase (TIGR02306 family)